GGGGGGGGVGDRGQGKGARKKHRATAATCPSARGSGNLPACPADAAPGAIPGNCRQDVECSGGTSGRCLRPVIGPSRGCDGICSYDDCVDDSGCPGSAPCECRASETSAAANKCETTSNCRVDADCGVGGFCSPSLVEAACDCLSPDLCDSRTHCYAGSPPQEIQCACGDSCGHGYYCHTPQDDCLD